jgi:hypothetical protein
LGSLVGTEFASSAPTLVTAPIFVAAFLYIGLVIGRRLLRLFGPTRGASPAERFVIGGAIGLGLLQFVPFLLGVLGVLTQLSLRIVLGVMFAVALLDLPPMVRALGRWWQRRRRPPVWLGVWLLILVIPLVWSFFVALAPAFDPDGLGYHLTAPKRWLEIHRLSFLPTLIYTNGPVGSEMLFASGLAVVGDAGAKLIHFTAASLAVAGVYLVGRRVGARAGGPFVAPIACTLFIFSPYGIYPVMGFGYAEGTAALAIVASTLCWMLWLDSADRSWLGVAALLAGVAVTFKLTSVVFPLALAALTVLVIRRRGRRATGTDGLTAGGIAGLVGICAAPVVPWLLRSLIVTGNPVFPVLAQWIPSKGFPADISRQFESYNRYMIWGTGARLYDLSLGTRKLILLAVILIVIAVGVIVYLRQRNPLHRVVTLVVVPTIVVQLYAAGLYLRYWTPIAAVLQIPVIALIATRLNRKVLLGGLMVLAALLSVGQIRTIVRDSPGDLVLASVDAGRRAKVLDDRVPLAKLMTMATKEKQPDEAVMTAYYCGGFYVDGPSLCAETLDSTLRMDDWDKFTEAIEDLNVTYVLAPTDLASGARPPDTGARSVTFLVRDEEYAAVSRLLQERGELVDTVRDQSLFRLRPTTGTGG